MSPREKPVDELDDFCLFDAEFRVDSLGAAEDIEESPRPRRVEVHHRGPTDRRTNMQDRSVGSKEPDSRRTAFLSGCFELRLQTRLRLPVVAPQYLNSALRSDRLVIGRGEVGALNPVGD